jgi:riboflavin kinase/FMN adenylyltransferase
VKVYRGDAKSWNPERTEYAVAIGVFDGVHRGHRAVFDSLSSHAIGHPRVALTFSAHPASVVASDPAPPLLATLDRRIELFDSAGLDAVAVIEFNSAVSQLTPEEFVDRYLVDALNAKVVSVGDGFRFGKGASGTVDRLRLLGQDRGFTIEKTPIVAIHGTEVRSSAIRAAIATGGVELAARMLGRLFDIEGVVVPGDGRGRSIGLPTANITMPDDLVRPAGGVYAVRCVVDQVAYNGVCNVGTRPTFGGGAETIEVHIVDQELDLYGKRVRVEFVDRLRNEQRFASVDALVAQITADIEQARDVLA